MPSQGSRHEFLSDRTLATEEAFECQRRRRKHMKGDSTLLLGGGGVLLSCLENQFEFWVSRPVSFFHAFGTRFLDLYVYYNSLTTCSKDLRPK